MTKDLTLLLYGGVYITPPTENWQLLLKIVIQKSPKFVTLPIYLWQTLPYLFWGSKWQKKEFLEHFCCWQYQFPDQEISFWSRITILVILASKKAKNPNFLPFWAPKRYGRVCHRYIEKVTKFGLFRITILRSN